MKHLGLHLFQSTICLLMVWLWANDARAQFHEMELLPWCPPRQSGTEQQVTDGGEVLTQLNEALQSGRYQEVAERLYPQAVNQGYQRNANLYNQTRRALRQLLQTPDGERYWPQMLRLYHDRYANIGQDNYEFRNTLETRAWCERQLDNERLLMLLSQPGREMECFDKAQQLLTAAEGKADPIWVVQGMFVPLNRAHAANSKQGETYTPHYREVLRWLEAVEGYMQLEHPVEYRDYYNTQTLAMVQDESRRLLTADAAIEDLEQRRHQLQEELRAQYESVNPDNKAQRIYAEALERYKAHRYADAFAKVNESLSVEDSREAHVLKSNILQAAANSSQEMEDKVAFWCAAYEAGRGYADKQTLAPIVSALRNHLFMSGMAGKTHTTRSPFRIRQRVWTIEQLRNL